VRQADGVPVSGATVTLIDVSGRQAGRDRTGADGSYQVPVTGQRTYTLIAMADGREPHASSIHVGDRPAEREVTLTGMGGLAGTVRAAGARTPLPGASVALLGPYGEVVSAQATDEAGRFGFHAVAPGPHTLAVTARACQPVAVPVVIGLGTAGRHDVELIPQARLEGIARNEAGVTVRDIRIMLMDGDGTTVAVTTTGADGRYAFHGLPTGDYTVIATGYPPVASKLTVASAQRHYHEVQLGHPEP
jgi:hypothetical protein